jgi:hypothetical protein
LASTITNYSNLIDINFPVPGADNDLQKFRDNFSNIKTSLEIANREINAVKTNGVFLTDNNNFNNNTITNATIVNCNIILKGYTSS